MHKYISKVTTIGSDNGVSPGWHQAIIWTNAGILLIQILATTLSKILSSCIFIQQYAFENVVCEMVAFLFRPQCVNAC